MYEFLFKRLEQARPLLADFPWIFVPDNRWNVLRREADSKAAYNFKEEKLKLISSCDTSFVALNPQQVVVRDETYLLDNLKGGMVTDGMCLYIYIVFVCLCVCVCVHVHACTFDQTILTYMSEVALELCILVRYIHIYPYTH